MALLSIGVFEKTIKESSLMMQPMPYNLQLWICNVFDVVSNQSTNSEHDDDDGDGDGDDGDDDGWISWFW